MKEYAKILGSILLSLISISFIASILIGLNELIGEGKFDGMVFPFFVALIGFICFGIFGSAIWYAILVFVSGEKVFTFKNHVVSAVGSTIITVILFSLLVSRFRMDVFVELLAFYFAVIPVVVVSLIFKRFVLKDGGT